MEVSQILMPKLRVSKNLRLNCSYNGLFVLFFPSEIPMNDVYIGCGLLLLCRHCFVRKKHNLMFGDTAISEPLSPMAKKNSLFKCVFLTDCKNATRKFILGNTRSQCERCNGVSFLFLFRSKFIDFDPESSAALKTKFDSVSKWSSFNE